MKRFFRRRAIASWWLAPTEGGTEAAPDLESARASAERSAIVSALRQCSGNAVDAAQMLDVSRATFYRLMKKHRIGLGTSTLSDRM